MDGQYNERALEWSEQIPPIMRGLAFNPPLVMPYIGSMFKSDTAMLRPGTRYVQDLPIDGDDILCPDPRSRSLPKGAKSTGGSSTPFPAAGNRRMLMPKEWREALEMLDAIYAGGAR